MTQLEAIRRNLAKLREKYADLPALADGVRMRSNDPLRTRRD